MKNTKEILILSLLFMISLPAIAQTQVGPKAAKPGTAPAPAVQSTTPQAGVPAAPVKPRDIPPPDRKEKLPIAEREKRSIDATMKNCFIESNSVCRDRRKSIADLRACLYEKRDTLKGMCARHVRDYSFNNRHIYAQNLKKHCEADAIKFCSNLAPGGKRVTECLKKQTGLSPACKNYLTSSIVAKNYEPEPPRKKNK